MRPSVATALVNPQMAWAAHLVMVDRVSAETTPKVLSALIDTIWLLCRLSDAEGGDGNVEQQIVVLCAALNDV